LIENFAFRSVNVKVGLQRGIIHTQLQGRLLGQWLAGSYDLEPSEYRRVKGRE
jgi:hypothetical protein